MHILITCIRLAQTVCTAQKLALFIISRDRQTQVLAGVAMAAPIIIDYNSWFSWSLSTAKPNMCYDSSDISAYRNHNIRQCKTQIP